jgi:ABC-type amino acid transport substrate-binding protein
MRHFAFLLSLMLATGADACTLRLGYTNQNAPPYYAGADTVAKAPGAIVELMQEMAASRGCKLELQRLPTARLMWALSSGQIDALAMTTPPEDMAHIALPLDSRGKPDTSRGLPQFTMIYVRTGDRAAASQNTIAFLRGRRVGVTHGVSFADDLRDAGMLVDDGAANARRNFDKLRLNRVDAVAVSLNAPGDMDDMLDREFGGQLVRLERPFRTRALWLMVNRTYYGANKAAVESMWSWLGDSGGKRLPTLLKKYETTR